MSFDAELNRVCPHMQVREYHTFFSDNKTVFLDRPMGTTQGMEVYLNDVLVAADHPISGWHLEADYTKVAEPNPTDWKKIVFNSARKYTDDYIEASYRTLQYNCIRCAGIGLYDDIHFSRLGKPVLAREEQKLLQDMEKIVITVLQSNPFHQWYGTSLLQLIGQGDRFRGALTALLQREVFNALTKLKSLQMQQARYQRVLVTEIIDSVLSVTATSSDIDPTAFEVTASVLSLAGNLLTVEKQIRIGGALLVERDLNSGRFVPQMQAQGQSTRIRTSLIGTTTR